jgi:hypothetical protein
MKKILFPLVLSLGVLSGCGADPSQSFVSNQVPKGFEDCAFGYMRDLNIPGSAGKLYMVRCPNSTTTATTSEKHPVTTVTIDNVEYIPKGSTPITNK